MRRPGDKRSSEPMMVSTLTHICVTRPQWINHHHPTTTPFSVLWIHTDLHKMTDMSILHGDFLSSFIHVPCESMKYTKKSRFVGMNLKHLHDEAMIQKWSFFINSSPLDKMAAMLTDDISHCIFFNKNEFWLKCNWSMFPWLQLAINHH